MALQGAKTVLKMRECLFCLNRCWPSFDSQTECNGNTLTERLKPLAYHTNNQGKVYGPARGSNSIQDEEMLSLS